MAFVDLAGSVLDNDTVAVVAFVDIIWSILGGDVVTSRLRPSPDSIV